MSRASKFLIAGLVAATAFTGAAQAEPFNIYSSAKQTEANTAPQVEAVRHHYYRRHRSDAGAALALGAIGAIAAGAAIAASRDRYYDDPYYYDGPPPRRYYRNDYCDNTGRPSHYPAPQGC
jgi:hypothetical protein